jgi:hypothetical protein
MNLQDDISNKSRFPMGFILFIMGFLLLVVVVWSIVLTLEFRRINKRFKQNITLLTARENMLHERINNISMNHYIQLSNLDQHVIELEHEIEVLASQLEIIDSAINGKDKRNARMNKIISAIKRRLPEYRSQIEGCTKTLTPGELWSIAGAIVDNADEYAVPASLIAAVIEQESAFCNNAISRVGAKGYMQLMPETAVEVSADVAVKTGRALRTWRGRDNIQLGTAYLSAMLLEFDGDIKLAAAAYNAGPTHVKKVIAGLVSEHTCKNGMITPYYCETADYMDKIQLYKQEYDKLGLN